MASHQKHEASMGHELRQGSSSPVSTDANTAGDSIADIASLFGHQVSVLTGTRVLEPRILLDAAGMDTVLDLSTEISGFDIPQGQIDPESQGGSLTVPFTGLVDDTRVEALGVEEPHPIIFIDGSLPDIATLVAVADPRSEIVILDTTSDGVEAIADYLADHDPVSAIHIVSHGGAGELYLGNAVLDLQSINLGHAGDLAVIGAALADGGDILIYGCDFAAGASGATALQALANATGADIAASDDLTGSAALGGDWDLEVTSGGIEAIALSPLAWASTLDLVITAVGVSGAAGVGVTGASVDALAGQILGAGVTINSSTYFGGGQQSGIFSTGPGASFGGNILGFTDGAIFSTGTASSVAGPNSAAGFTVNAPGIDGDAEFNALAGNATFDASFIVINFTPDVPPGASVGDTGRMTMQIVFGSDEYNEFVYAGVNDTLAVIVNGVNQATVPNGLAIGIDTINAAGSFNPGSGNPANDPNPEHVSAGFESANPSLYINNESGTFNTQMDGFTITLPVTFDVIVGQANTLKIGIADTGDPAWDSWMFVKADSGQTVIVAENDSVTTPTNIPFNIDVTANDYDLQGDTLTVTHILGQPVSPGDTITLASGVDVTLELDGTLTVEGNGVDPANDAFTYSITDGNGGTSTAFVNVNILEFNTSPVANNNGPVAVTEDTPVSGNLITDVPGADTDADGDILEVTTFTIPGVGTFTAGDTGVIPNVGELFINTDGNYTFTPAQDYFGPVPTVTYTVTDNKGGTDTATLELGPVTSVNDAPVIDLDNDDSSDTTGAGTGANFETTYIENAAGIAIVDSDFTLTDVDNQISELAVILTDGQIGDTMNFPSVMPGGITASVFPTATLAAPGPLTVTLTGTGATTEADWQAALASIIFLPSTNDVHNPDPADRHITVQASDANSANSNLATATIHVIPENDPPTLDLDDFNTSGINSGNYQGSYVENAVGAPISDGVVITDLDDANLEGMTITLTNGEVGDILNVGALPAGITLVGAVPAELATPGTITVELTGAATLSAYQNAIAAITFANSGDDPVAGVREITVVGTDGTDQSPTRTAFLTVVPVNDAPQVIDPLNPGSPPADPDAVVPVQSGSDGTAVTPVDASQFFADPDDTVLTYSLGPSAPSWLSIDSNTGVVTGTPPSDASQNTNNGTPGEYEVIVIASDPDLLTAQTTVTFTITNPAPVVDVPVADQNFSDNQSVSITPSMSDPDGDTLSYSATGLPAGLSINPLTGEISGTVDNSASQGGPLGDGIYTVTITADDGQGGTVDDVVTFTITNPAPVAENDAATGDEDSIATGNLLAANPVTPDTDPDGDAITVTRVASGNDGTALAGLADGSGVGPATVTGSTGGTFTVNSDGSYSFDPGTDFQDLGDGESRITEIVYQIDDGEGGTDTAVVSFTVTGSNDGPVVIDPNDPFPNPNDPPVPADPVNVIPDQSGNDGQALVPLDISPYFFDVDGDVLTYGFDPLDPDVPAWLSIDLVTGIITGTPPGDASQGGPLGDGVYTVTVTATDPDGEVVTTTIDFNIANIAPTAVDDIANGDEDNVQTGNVLSDPVTGDADTPPDSDPLTVTGVNGIPVSTGNPAVLTLAHGELTLNEDGSWSFAPNALANQLSDTDPDAVETVTYTIDDGNGGTDTATLTINIAGVNDPVQVVNPNDPSTDPTDPSYDPLNPTVIADPDNLIPDVLANDGDSPAPLDVSPWFGDAEGDTLTFSATDLPSGLSIDPVTGIISGVIASDASQNGNTATPGEYLVVITVEDPQGNFATTTVSYTITNVPPIARDDAVNAAEDGVSTGDLFADNGNGVDQDTPPDSDPIAVSAVGGISGNVGPAVPGSNGGLFTINANGTYSFDPGSDFQDLDVGETRQTSIEYTIDDGNGGTDTATIVVTVDGANDAPVVIDPDDPFPNPKEPPVPADPDNVIPDQNGDDSLALTPIDVSPYFVDVDGEPLTFGFDPADPDVPAWLLIDPVTGIITGTAPSDASIGGPAGNGVYPITITATDPDGAMVTTTLDFTILNIPPVVTGVLPEQTETAGYFFEMPTAGVFNDPDNDTLAYSVTGLPAGLVIDPATGLISGTVDPNAVNDAPNGDGVYSVTVTVDDGQGGLVSTGFTLTIHNLPFVSPLNEPTLPPLPYMPGDGGSGFVPQMLIVGNAVEDLAPLAQGVGLYSNYVVGEAVASLSEPAGDTQDPGYAGGNALVLQSSGIEYQFRSFRDGGVLHLEFTGSWSVSGPNGTALPDWIDNVDGQMFTLKFPAGTNSVGLTLTGLDADNLGKSIRITIDAVSGAIVATMSEQSALLDENGNGGLSARLIGLKNQVFPNVADIARLAAAQ
ncbi:MAG: putative Ig domain-containing protein [Nitratireductor sp.]